MAEAGQTASQGRAQDLAQGWAMLGRDPAGAQRVAEAAGEGDDARLLVAAALRRQGDIAGAHGKLAPLMAAGMQGAIASFEWGMVLHATGAEAQAAEALRQATRLEPGFTAAWRALGDVLLQQNLGPNADVAYAQAARAAVAGHAHLAAAAALLADRRPLDAERILLDLVRRTPTDVPARFLLGEASLRVGRIVQAEAAFARCIGLAPRYADARHSLATLFYVQRKFGQARALFASLLAMAPYVAGLRIFIAICSAEMGDFAEVAAQYDVVLRGWPDQAAILLAHAHALKTMGREEEAAAQYRRCIALGPDWASGAYLSLADMRTQPLTEAEAGAMRAALASASVRPDDASRLHYALGRVEEQRGDYGAAFGHYADGARLRRGAIAYDADAAAQYVAAARRVFTADFFASRQGVGCEAGAPVFVVGLPRSGSTLVEQILASHPDIEGTGELREMGDIAAGLRQGGPLAALPDAVAALDGAALRQLGQRYLDLTAQYRSQGRPFFIDKMPDNFLHAALIALVLPRARIVDVRRAPMAAGMAVFRQYFQPQQAAADFSYDLGEIGRYTRDYLALMAHYDAVLPGRIHLVRYEALVGDLDGEVRRLLDYVGVPFEPACLRFWETARAVQTPSAQQVRRPIFREGLDQWRQYAAWLGPLRAALGEDAGDDDAGAPRGGAGAGAAAV